jgi:hypothetical protein
MKILQVIDTLRSGGKERQLVEVLKFLSQHKDVKCELLIMSGDIHYDYIEKLNIRIYKVIRKTKKDPICFFESYIEYLRSSSLISFIPGVPCVQFMHCQGCQNARHKIC